MEEELFFLSPEWIHKVTAVIQGTRSKDENFRKLTSGYSLNLAYVLTDLPLKLRELYSNNNQAVLFVQLDKGRVKKLEIGTELPKEKTDFTITSTYNVVKQIFAGELNPASTFISGQLKVEPLSRVYSRPRFTAKSIVAANAMLKLARQVPTGFVQS
jgi:putative sterol carrier protein